ncbi:MAG: outer membrane beta-barrel protein, partial [Anderseniella sp.]
MMNKILCGASAFAVMVAFGASSVKADELELSRVVAGDMPTVRDRFNGLGIRTGQFWILPTVETGVFYDSNARATSANEQDDFGFYVSPTLDIKSDFGRHAINAKAGLDHFNY